MSKKIKVKPIPTDDWKTGSVPATKMQKEELTDLGKPADVNLSKAGATHQIEQLQKKTTTPKKKS